VDYRILGPLAVEHDGRALELGPAKEQALLAALVVRANQVVATDRLVEDVWGNNPPPSAPGSLRVHVSRLRKSLRAGGDVLTTHAAGYRLGTDESAIDAVRFERRLAEGRQLLATGDAIAAADTLRAALSEWRGELLAGVAAGPALLAEALRLEERHMEAVELRLEADLACGRHAGLAPELDALVDAHPLRERLWAALVLALYRCGRQADALRAFQGLRRILKAELDAEPGGELLRLEEAILHQRAELDWVPPSAPVEGGVQGRGLPHELDAAADVFVGRTSELHRLAVAWDATVWGQRSAVLLAGEPGIGKTSLAAAFARTVDANGGIVLFGRCDDQVLLPYQPFAQALHRWLTRDSDAPAATSLDLTELLPPLPEHLRGDAEVERLWLFDAVVDTLAAASTNAPVLLVLDDLHWAAPSTVLLLRHVLRSSPSMRLLVVVTYRDTDLEPGNPLADALGDLRAEPGAGRLALAGLDREGVAELVSASGGRADMAERLWAETRGNPLFVTELVAHLQETGADDPVHFEVPDGVRDVIARRLGRLSPTVGQALRAAAVAGQTFSLRLLETVEAAGPADHLLDAFEEAATAALLVEVPGGYAFAHALVRQVLLDSMTATRRAYLHRAIAQAIEALPNSDHQLEALAHHYAEAAADGDVIKAVEFAQAAARQARGQLAFEAAIAHLQRGTAVIDAGGNADPLLRAELALLEAEINYEVGQYARFQELAREAAAMARAGRSGRHLARAARMSANFLAYSEPDPFIGELCEEALEVIDRSEPTLRGVVMSCLARFRSYSEGLGVVMEAMATDALALTLQEDDEAAQTYALDTLAITLFGTPRVEERLDILNRSAAIQQSTIGVRARAATHLELGDMAAFEADVARHRADATRRGLQLTKQYVVTFDVLRAMLAGRLDEAELLLQQGLAQAGGDRSYLGDLGGQLLLLRREQGRLAEAMPLLRYAVAESGGMGLFRCGLTAALAETGAAEEARRELADLALDDFGSVLRDLSWTVSLGFLTEAATQLGDAATAKRVLDHFEPHSGHLAVMGWGVLCLGAVDRFLGMLALTVGRLDTAVAYLEAGLAKEQTMGLPAFRARSGRWLGAALLQRSGPGDRGRARTVLQATADEAAALGMPALAAEAKHLLSR
jgi:DNA-binding SARP family transcriptional activator